MATPLLEAMLSPGFHGQHGNHSFLLNIKLCLYALMMPFAVEQLIVLFVLAHGV